MSQNENDQKEPWEDLVPPVSDYIPTDSIIDLKTGIYNLFVSLLNNLMVHYGPIDAVHQATAYLDQISNTFKKTLPNNEEQEQSK
jgi:hypothetical protein